MKYFLLSNVDGSVQVMQIVQQADGSYSAPDREMAKWVPQKRAEVQSWREIEPERLPKDRTFRNAWRDGGKVVGVDMPAAREIHRNRLRAMRDPKLAALDIEMTRALDDKDKQGDIERRRQALRDVTADAAIDKASTPEDLAAVIPGVLKG